MSFYIVDVIGILQLLAFEENCGGVVQILVSASTLMALQLLLYLGHCADDCELPVIVNLA